ncbi:baseplate J/gp47 family protein [Vibrio europaeus]|uniref:baseplate J/gp47 family protein n=1 Tax=Vibrio europaeus TaxID=300876 RepID=UPI00233F501E|nr:baseplate J/gp47 family protein [Vibrio europaeus]MDC5753868.1 baseplate J/gp47 family protein [Vibrio europaeus]MDC5776780.1 baseplate J/gp47 family protein [Vibrio europaeus]MDC5796796.1 baseplate J/gp47 family protein [Vibrio europaeus]MDC5801793.1 baseplate J/gp47 family protein [Vibrio europaeus]MDC5815766.1 baseplate J/gp47 family protein [Vibrio europaeus]
MAYQSQSLRDIIKQLEADMALSLDVDTLPIIGPERAIAFAVGAAKRDIHDHIDWLAKQIVPSSDSAEQTIIDAAAYEGVPRKLATKSSGKAEIAADTGSELDVGTIFQHSNGLRFIVTSATPETAGKIAFEFEAEALGSAGNLAGEEHKFSFVSPIPRLASSATITKIGGGADLEPIGELLSRLYFRKQNPPMGGAVHDYEGWAIEVPEVTRAWAYDAYQGGSTMGLAFVCDNLDDIIPTDTKQQEVTQYIYKHQDPATKVWVGRPGGIELILFKLRLKAVSMEIKLTPDTTATRKAVISNLNGLERAYSNPNATILLSQVRTAIGSATGVTDYTCSLTGNITSEKNELITFKEPQWVV